MSAARRSAIRSTLAAALLLSAGCTSWYPQPTVLAKPLAADDEVRLCVHGTCRQVHGVRVVGDSTFAVMYFKPVDCDSCTLRYATRDIDQVETRGVDRGKTTTLLVFAVPVVLYFVVLSIVLPRT